MRRFLCAAAFLAAAFFVVPASAQDARRGSELAEGRCAGCHGANGRSQLHDIPSLAGQQPGFIIVQLILMREGVRPVAAMAPFVENLPDKDIEDLAAHYASLPPGPSEDRTPRDTALFFAGQALIGPRNCAVCHMPTLVGREQMPRIIHQREDFLARTLGEYRSGQRVGADPQMNGAVVGLTNADIAALAHYLAHRD